MLLSSRRLAHGNFSSSNLLFRIVPSKCFFAILNPQHTVSSINFLNAEKIVVVLQPSAAAQRYEAGSTHTVSGNCWHALGMHPHPRIRLSASGQFLVCYHTLLIRTQIL
jgi:hypothetical protein